MNFPIGTEVIFELRRRSAQVFPLLQCTDSVLAAQPPVPLPLLSPLRPSCPRPGPRWTARIPDEYST
jgi:hypothetical protein